MKIKKCLKFVEELLTHHLYSKIKLYYGDYRVFFFLPRTDYIKKSVATIAINCLKCKDFKLKKKTNKTCKIV